MSCEGNVCSKRDGCETVNERVDPGDSVRKGGSCCSGGTAGSCKLAIMYSPALAGVADMRPVESVQGWNREASGLPFDHNESPGRRHTSVGDLLAVRGREGEVLGHCWATGDDACAIKGFWGWKDTSIPQGARTIRGGSVADRRIE